MIQWSRSNRTPKQNTRPACRLRVPIETAGPADRGERRYYLVTQAVRAGSLLKFNEVVSKYDTLFKQDRNSTLIVR